MIIRGFHVERYKQLANLAIALAPGLNVIRGPNEAGKSTLHSALRAALYQSPKGTSAAVREGYSWAGGEPYRFQLTFTVDDEQYELEKDFAARSALLQDASGNVLRDIPEINRQLAQWLGCPSEAFFESTACIDQLEICGITQGQRELSAALQTRLAGAGDEPAQAAIDRLESYAKRLTAGGKTPGQLTAAQSRVSELRERCERLNASITALLADRARLAETAARLAELAASLEEREGLAQKSSQARALRGEIAGMEERYSRYTQARSLRERIGELERALGAVRGWNSPAAEEVQRTREQIGQIERELAQTAAQRAGHDALAGSSGGRPLVYAGLLLVALGLAAAVAFPPLLVVGLLGLALIVYGLRKSGEAKPPTDPAAYQSQRELAVLSERLAALLDGLGYPDEASFHAALEHARGLEAERLTKSEMLTLLLDGRPWEQYEAEEHGLALRLEQKRDALAQLAPFELDPLALERLEREIARFGDEQAQAERERIILDDRLARSGADPEALAASEEELAAAERRLALLAARRQAALIAREYLARAQQETTVRAVDVLQSELGRLMARISGDRYHEATIDPEGMAIRVQVAELPAPVAVDRLSTATKEQCYLAARLSLVKHLTGGARPPLLLDDPFVNFDDQRRYQTMLLLQELAREYQILLFTCADHYDQYAARVISLGETAS